MTATTALATYIESVKGYTPRDLATLADVGNADVYVQGEDHKLTEGADMLDTVWRDFIEALEAVEGDWEDVNRDKLEDAVSEWADSAVTIWNSARVQALLDLQAWDEDISDFGTPDSIIQGIGWALYEIARRLGWALVNEFFDADRDNFGDAQ